MDAQNFNIFKEMFEVYKLHPLTSPKYKNIFIENIEMGLKTSKIFEMDQDIKKILLLSRPPKINSDLKLPFDTFFIDISFGKEDLEKYGIKDEIFGIMVKRGNFLYDDGSVAGDDLRVTVCIVNKNETLFNTSSIPLDFTKERYEELNKQLNEKRDINAFAENFILCFINLLTFRDITIKEIIRTEKGNNARIRKGKSPIPSTSIIVVVGEIKRYIDSEKNKGEWYFNYSFWVMGHFRRLKHKRYKTVKRIWIMPYIKGKGMEVKKSYKICSGGKD